MTDKVMIIGNGDSEKHALYLYLAGLKEKYGDDVIVVSSDEAKELEMTMDDFSSRPPMKITAPPIFSYREIEKSGKEKRRLRRQGQRKCK